MPRRGLVAGPDFETFRRRYFTPVEVAQHNQPDDLWVSYLGSVYDLTPLAQKHKGKGHTRSAAGCLWVPGSRAASIDGGCAFPGDLLLKPIVEVAGQDISHWFDPKTKDVSSAWCWVCVCVWRGEALESEDGEEKEGLARARDSDCSHLPPPNLL